MNKTRFLEVTGYPETCVHSAFIEGILLVKAW